MQNHNDLTDSEIEKAVEDAFEWVGEKFMLITCLIGSQFVALAALLALLAIPIFWAYVAYEIYARVFGDHSGALVIFTPDSYYWFWPFVTAVLIVMFLYVVGLLIFLGIFHYIGFNKIKGNGKIATFTLVITGLFILIPICVSAYYLYHPLFNLLKSWF